VDRGAGPYAYNSEHFEWNNASNNILITLFLPDEGRYAFTSVGLNNDPSRLPPVYRYDYGSWSWDGTRALASGGGEDGRVGLRWVDPVSGSVELIFDSGARGLWLQDAVERPDGQIVALGSFAGAQSPMSLYDSTGKALTTQIGSAPPTRAAWSPDRSAVLVEVDDGIMLHYYVAGVDGSVREITASVAGALAIEWVGGVLPPSSDQPAQAVPTLVPTPVVQSQYGLNVNEAVQVISPAGVNLRSAPSTDAPIITLLQAFEYVVIVAGPVQNEGIIWWQVQTATNLIGWVAESVNGIQLLSETPL
jgi:hypothetical protein